MIQSIRRIKVLTKKDFYDFFKNPALMIHLMVPLFFAILYSRLDFGMDDQISTDNVLMLCVVMNITITCTLIISQLIAEEKEKLTLQTLMLSNVNGVEFLLAKTFLTYIISCLGNILIYIVLGIEWKYFGVFMLSTTFGALPLILCGATLGIIAKDQMTCSIMQMPFLFIFLLPPILGTMNETLATIAKFTPTNAFIDMFFISMNGNLWSTEVLFQIAVILYWILAGYLLFLISYQKIGLEN